MNHGPFLISSGQGADRLVRTLRSRVSLWAESARCAVALLSVRGWTSFSYMCRFNVCV